MKKLSLSKKLAEKIITAFAVGIPVIIFAFSILVFINYQELFSVSFVIYLVLVTSLACSVGIFFNKRRFLTFYRFILHPLFGLLILSLFYWLIPKPFNEVWSFSWISFSALLVSFVIYAWLKSLRSGDDPFQTGWIYHLSLKFGWYILLALGAMILGNIFLYYQIPSLTQIYSVYMYLVILSYYFLILFVSSLLLLNVGKDVILKFGRKNLTKIRNMLISWGKLKDSTREIFIKDYLPVFSFIIDWFNQLVKDDYPDLQPNISDSDQYKKALFASIIPRRNIKRPVKGIDLMLKALGKENSSKKINFKGFIKGLLILEGKKTELVDITETFKIKPPLQKRLSRNYLTIVFAILTFVGILVPIYLALPKESPLGEAIIINPLGSEEVTPSLSRDGKFLFGWVTCDYNYVVLNNHEKNIQITEVNITGPSPIRYVSATGRDTIPLSVENTKLEIKNFEVKSPLVPIVIQGFDRDMIEIKLSMDFDLREWKEIIMNDNFDAIFIWGPLQIEMSYNIMGENVTKSISENLHFNFIFPITS